MSLKPEQVGQLHFTKAHVRKKIKKTRNKWLRQQAKNSDEHPKANRYRGWAD